MSRNRDPNTDCIILQPPFCFLEGRKLWGDNAEIWGEVMLGFCDSGLEVTPSEALTCQGLAAAFEEAAGAWTST